MKINKYAPLTDRFHFVPVAVETSGVFGPKTLSFLRKLGALTNAWVDYPKESMYLFQRLSLAIVRGNAHAILSAGRREDKLTTIPPQLIF